RELVPAEMTMVPHHAVNREDGSRRDGEDEMARTHATEMAKRPFPVRDVLYHFRTAHEITLDGNECHPDVDVMEFERGKREPVSVGHRLCDVETDDATERAPSGDCRQQLRVATSCVEHAVERELVCELEDEAPTVERCRRVPDHVVPLRPALVVIGHLGSPRPSRRILAREAGPAVPVAVPQADLDESRAAEPAT